MLYSCFSFAGRKVSCLLEAADRGDSKTLYVITKSLSRRKAFADSKPIKSKTGDLLETEEAQLKHGGDNIYRKS
ncbi:hypothetical protein J6590_082409 [Homalodisca vitripennis]|nr:hypothetical protein J6590_082409 [Homalodisca vitripennis]